MNWKEENNRLQRTFELEDFQAALALVNKIAALAEVMKHHPDITLRDYRFVDVSMTTHDEGNQVTDKDRMLAAQINLLVA
jgi:4a-hydroxytetrahydrobiopterin dehydratase